jgi:glycosyltransferase involved in cell wall biosynthesis
VVSSYPPRHCGIGVYARDQVARLRAEGYQVTVLSPPDGDGDITESFIGGRVFSRAARKRGFDRIIVHFQPALYYKPKAPVSKVLTSARLLFLAAAARRNLTIVVHEADPPVRWRPDYILLRWAFRVAPRLEFHTKAERAAFEGDYGIRARAVIAPHTVRPVDPSGNVSTGQARDRLGLDPAEEPVFLCIGFLQPSKGFDRAVRAFAGAGGGSLYVVGSLRDETTENLAHVEELRRLCASTPGATLAEGFLDDAAFDLWISAADWVVLPYRRSWSSGVLARAHALGTPAIMTGEGGLPEQAGSADVVVAEDWELGAAMRERVSARAATSS